MPNEPTAAADAQRPAPTDTPIYDDLVSAIPGFAEGIRDVPDNPPAGDLRRAS